MAIAMISTAIWFAACQKETSNSETSATTTEAVDRDNGNSKVFPPNAHPYGKSYDEWTVNWLQVFVTFDCANNPWLHPETGVLFYQSGPVYFMAGLSTPGASANVTVPHGKAILFPLFNYLNDYPCPAEYNFEPVPPQTLEEFLTEGAVAVTALATNLSVTIDGASVSNPASYLFTTDLFYFTGNEDLSNNCYFDVCITGDSQPGVGSGYYMMLKPLSKGEHIVHYHIDIPAWNAQQDGTFNITVQ